MSQEIGSTASELIRRKATTDPRWRDVKPQDIAGLFYRRLIPDDAAPIVGGKRRIPAGLEWLIESKLKATGVITG